MARTLVSAASILISTLLVRPYLPFRRQRDLTGMGCRGSRVSERSEKRRHEQRDPLARGKSRKDAFWLHECFQQHANVRPQKCRRGRHECPRHIGDVALYALVVTQRPAILQNLTLVPCAR